MSKKVSPSGNSGVNLHLLGNRFDPISFILLRSKSLDSPFEIPQSLSELLKIPIPWEPLPVWITIVGSGLNVNVQLPRMLVSNVLLVFWLRSGKDNFIGRRRVDFEPAVLKAKINRGFSKNGASVFAEERYD